MTQYFSSGWIEEEPDYRYGPIARMVHDDHGEYKPALRPEDGVLIANDNTPEWVLDAGVECGYDWEYRHDGTPPSHIQPYL